MPRLLPNRRRYSAVAANGIRDNPMDRGNPPGDSMSVSSDWWLEVASLLVPSRASLGVLVRGGDSRDGNACSSAALVRHSLTNGTRPLQRSSCRSSQAAPWMPGSAQIRRGWRLRRGGAPDPARPANGCVEFRSVSERNWVTLSAMQDLTVLGARLERAMHRRDTAALDSPDRAAAMAEIAELKAELQRLAAIELRDRAGRDLPAAVDGEPERSPRSGDGRSSCR
jgi:hypothetical protein